MPLFFGRPALRLLCALAILLPLSGGSQAQTKVEPPSDGAIQLDQSVQAMKDEVTQFNRDAQLAEDEFLYPPQSRLSVYVSNNVTGLLLAELSVTVDNAAPVIYRYDEYDSRALLQPGALQRVLRSNVSRGAHRIKATFTAKMVDGDGALTGGTYEGIFDKTLDPADIELQISRLGRNKGYKVTLREWRVAR